MDMKAAAWLLLSSESGKLNKPHIFTMKTQITTGLFFLVGIRMSFHALDRDQTRGVLGPVSSVTTERGTDFWRLIYANAKIHPAYFLLLHALPVHLETTAALLCVQSFCISIASPIFGPLHRTNLTASSCDTLSKPSAVFQDFSTASIFTARWFFLFLGANGRFFYALCIVLIFSSEHVHSLL